jgi:glycosyltransferase involved in cell wall biosynthesis
VNVCTIVAKNYLAHARTLAESFREHHPDGRFTVLVIDEVEGFVDAASEPFDVLGCTDIGLPDLEAMATRYDVLELSTAVKPWLLRTLLDDRDHVIYLDPDIRVFASLEPLAERARDHGLVLTPHDLGAMPRDGLKPSEADILIAGAYNLGFIGLGASEATEGVLDWWSERLLTDCIVDPERGYFVDQRWMDLVLGTVPDFELVRDPAYNVAYWNLHNRRLSKDGETYLVDGNPLRFFHFSGYDPRRPHLLSKHQNRIRIEDDPVLLELCEVYGRALLDAGFEEVIEWPYSYRAMASGVPLDRALRRAWSGAVKAGDLEAPLFDREGEEAFVGWLADPAPEGAAAGVNRFMYLHWQARSDLMRAFPFLDRERDAEGLVEWFQLLGVNQVSVPPGIVPDPPVGETSAEPAGTAVSAAASVADLPAPLGVNVVGYLRSEHGVGEVARLAIAALDAAELPVYPVGLQAYASRQGHPYAVGTPAEAPYPVNLLCVNADQTTNFAAEAGRGFFAGRRTVGWWWWEVEGLPDDWYPAFDVVDELWAGSRFIADNLSRIAPVPVVRIPMPISLPPDVRPNRAGLDLPPGYLFLFTFDHNSVFDRKNPLGVVEAFRRAFPDPAPGGPRLVIRSINADRFPRQHALLVEAVGDRPDIVLMDRYLSADDKNAMLAVCDCYVSLHRAEGFGIGMAEAMLLGKPVIATAWSGSADFMLPEHSYPVDHRLAAIGPGNEPYPPDGRWASPDLDQAARHMRDVVEHPGEARRRGALAAAFIREHHSPAVAGAAMRDRLQAIADGLPDVERPQLPSPPPVSLDSVRQVTQQGPPRSPRSRVDPRRIGRAAALRLGTPQRRYHEQSDREIVSGVEYVADQLRVYASSLAHLLRGELSTEIARQSARARADALAADRRRRSDITALRARVEDVVLAHEQLVHRIEFGDLARANGGRSASPSEDSVDPPVARPLETLPRRHPPTDAPWTHEYNDRHRALVREALDSPDLPAFLPDGRLPEGYGRGYDERVVEYPWMLANGVEGRLLDAGSVLNHPHILDRVLPRVDELTIVTLAPEERSFPERGISYMYADLRELPYRDGVFDTVVSVSTLEHVGMDNTAYGSAVPRSEDPARRGRRRGRRARPRPGPGRPPAAHRALRRRRGRGLAAPVRRGGPRAPARSGAGPRPSGHLVSAHFGGMGARVGRRGGGGPLPRLHRRPDARRRRRGRSARGRVRADRQAGRCVVSEPAPEQRLEHERARADAADAQVGELERRLTEAEQVAARAVAAEHELASTRATLEQRIEVLEARERELERLNRELDATAAHFRTLNDALMGSASWKVTRPLRALKRG